MLFFWGGRGSILWEIAEYRIPTHSEFIGMGLEKDQQGPSEFIEPKVPISKYGLGYQKPRKLRRSKAKAKKKTLRQTFVEEGANYPYTGKPEQLMIAEKLVPGFEIFDEEVNGTKEPIIEEHVVEELVQVEEPKRTFLQWN